MRERVEFVGGSLAVESSADGTQVVFTLPATRRSDTTQAREPERASAQADGADNV